MEFAIQLIIILICLFYGARKGGIALGLLGGIGLVILVFVFHLQPGKPPVDVMLVIIAVVAASATLQASGGLDVMLQIAEKLLRRNPKYVSIVAPFVTCTLTILCGTGHVVYTILPIIYDVAIKNNIRPERPMAASSIGAQMGIIASPVSVAVVSLVAMLGNFTFNGKHRVSRSAGDNHSVHAAGYFSHRYLQLVPRQRPGSGRSLPCVYCAPGEPPLRLWRYGDPAGQKAADQQLDSNVDFSGLYRRGGAAWRFF